MPLTIACCTLFAFFPIPPRSSTPTETLIRMTVSPMAAPKPALRYQLLPELREMQPGNPIPNYMKCYLDQDFTSRDEVLGPSALKIADRAARLDKADWQILLRAKADGFSLLLPDLQKMRALASALQTRFRSEIALRQYDAAIATAKTMFALARHTGEHPTLIGNLVGVAIAMVTIAPIEELLEQPGCPNLYWALTNLPYPLISLDSGAGGERLLFMSEFRELLDSEPMTGERIKKVIERVDLIRRFEMDKIEESTRLYLTVRGAKPEYLAAARSRLVESGLAEERVKLFPPFQILLLDELRAYEVQRDEEAKLLKLTTWEFEEYSSKLARPKEPGLLNGYTIAFSRVRRAQGRIEQRISLLRHIEAIRIYAAENAGTLPNSLDDIKLPLPVDPFTGKAFRYSKEGEVAHLRGTPPKNETNAAFNLHYEITMRKNP